MILLLLSIGRIKQVLTESDTTCSISAAVRVTTQVPLLHNRENDMNLKTTLKRIITGPELQPIPNLRRNELCWCGSGKKYKGCHLDTDARKRAAMRSNGSKQGPMTRGF